MHLLLLLILFFVFTAKIAASTDNNNNNIRRLDTSGQAVQLQHAAAATHRARLVVVARCANHVTVVLSPCTQQPWQRRSSENGSSSSSSSLIQPTCATGRGGGGGGAIVCTGLQADARWLYTQLRSYTRAMMERYGEESSVDIAPAISALLRQTFWGYSQKETLPTLLVTHSLVENEQWGRPVGVEATVLETLERIGPTGSIVRSQEHFVCMGGGGGGDKNKKMGPRDDWEQDLGKLYYQKSKADNDSLPSLEELRKVAVRVCRKTNSNIRKIQVEISRSDDDEIHREEWET